MNAADLKAGDKYEMVFPFHRQGVLPEWQYWIGGCEVNDETYEPGIGERFFTAHGEGKVIYEILSIAEMPGHNGARDVLVPPKAA